MTLAWWEKDFAKSRRAEDKNKKTKYGACPQCGYKLHKHEDHLMCEACGYGRKIKEG